MNAFRRGLSIARRCRRERSPGVWRFFVYTRRYPRFFVVAVFGVGLIFGCLAIAVGRLLSVAVWELIEHFATHGG